ncbi:hypothetical protein ABT329_25185, partial [Streptomyces minutiscleroticus]
MPAQPRAHAAQQLLPPVAPESAGGPGTGGLPAPVRTGRALRGAGGRPPASGRGYSVMLGYWDEPERTAEAVDPGRWMHTG